LQKIQAVEGKFFYRIFSVVRVLLYPLALIYGALVWLRNRFYDWGVFSAVEFSLPVITVGNLSTGGTGKTPHVEYLVQLLQYRYRIATMSRGYKRETQGFAIADASSNALTIGDEPLQYLMKFPELTVSVAEDRMTGIPNLLQKQPSIEVVILDDAYQHRSVKAGMNILITDYSHPFYKDHILPFGSLREQRDAYLRANIIIVSKCPQSLSESERDSILKEIKPAPHQSVYFTAVGYGAPYELFSREVAAIQNKNIVLVCGIAKPSGLMRKVQQDGAAVHMLRYKDHHYYSPENLEEIQAAVANWQVADKIVVTTEKDTARLLLHADKLRTWETPIVILPIQVVFLFGGSDALDAQITGFADAIIAENNPTMPLS
jgi:tetraacyldisaccharide 4'-kinase